jgi:hypothetical protein
MCDAMGYWLVIPTATFRLGQSRSGSTDRKSIQNEGHPPSQLRTLGPELGQHQKKTRSANMTETRYTREFADEVCRRLAEGASLREVCQDHGVPESSVRQWVRDNRDNFSVRYQTARVLQVEAWGDLIIEIGNRDDLDPQEKRVRIDSLKWLMSRIVPKKWGDRLLVAGDESSPVHHLHKAASLTDLTDAQLEALDRFTTSLLVDAKAD